MAKATFVGTLAEVRPITKMNNKKFLQELIVVEPALGQHGKEKPTLIQNWGDTEDELERMFLSDLQFDKVKVDCYVNGYSYPTDKHGTCYGIRAVLINISAVNG